MLSVPWLRGAGLERDGTSARAAADRVCCLCQERSSADGSDAAVHGEGCIRLRAREHLRLRGGAAGPAVSAEHSVAEVEAKGTWNFRDRRFSPSTEGSPRSAMART